MPEYCSPLLVVVVRQPLSRARPVAAAMAHSLGGQRGPAPSSRASGCPVGCYDFGPFACVGCGFLGLLLPLALLAFRSPQAMMVPAATPFVSVATCTFTE